VHGWSYLPVAPGVAARRSVERAAALVEEVTGTHPRWYRPPYGLLTGPALQACRAVGLTPVLWSVRGLDRFAIDPDRIARALVARLRGGATLALHPRAGWRACLRALPGLLALCGERGLRVGSLAEHGLGGAPTAPGRLVVRIVHSGATRSRATAGVDGPSA
jgi:peptidoglycan/xylan/chitin deacetylase (PgdA/CDA1 family)